MDFQGLHVTLLHNHPKYLKQCCDMINEEWPRSQTARMTSLKASCDELPTSLILINNNKTVIGHCKLTRIPNMLESCFIETVVISKDLRGKKLGTYLMRKVEEYCKNKLKLSTVHLSTKGQEHFYAKLGYEICAPVSVYGTSFNFFRLTKNCHNDKDIVPKVTNSQSIGAPPPPPPPMPKIDNVVSNNNTIKSNKTFMFKYLT